MDDVVKISRFATSMWIDQPDRVRRCSHNIDVVSQYEKSFRIQTWTRSVFFSSEFTNRIFRSGESS